MSTQARSRTRGGFSNQTVRATVYLQGGGSYDENSSYSVGSYESMVDVVTSPFLKGRTIVNSPMTRTVETRAYTPANWYQNTLNPTPPSGSAVRAIGLVAKHDFSSEFTKDMFNSSLFDYHRINVQAATKAYANIVKPEVAGLVAIAELKQTLSGLINPLASIKKFLFGYKFQSRRERRKGKRNTSKDKANASTAAQATADQHLAIIFGLMPFIDDIKGILKALQEVPIVSQRFTARGQASDITNTSRYVAMNEPANSNAVGGVNLSYTRTVTSRAYVLYEAAVDIDRALGLSLDEVPRALWQHLTLSFVVDWFSNVSDFISAITPKTGIRILAQGLSVSIVDAHNATYALTLYGNPPDGWVGSYTGLQQARIVTTKMRIPGNLAPYIGLSFKHNMHKDTLDTFKITAAISLITQKLKSFI